jgi:hypothetical protein
MISDFESKISIDLSFEAKNGLQGLLSSHILPADVIHCAVPAVLSLMKGFRAFSTDASSKVAQIAKAVLCGPLLNKQPNLFHNNFVEAILILMQ